MADFFGLQDPLPAVYDRLIPLVVSNLEWWRDGVRRWAAKRIPLQIPLPGILSQDDKIALLAAIYDFHAAPAAQIDPWRESMVMPDLPEGSKQPIPGTEAYHQALADGLVTYHRLVDDVGLLRQQWDTHEAIIELSIFEVANLLQVNDANHAANRPHDKSTEAATTAMKPKRSTQNGDAKDKLIAALTKHHKYADNSCLNFDPIQNNELARRAEVAKSTATEFFNRQFNNGKPGGYKNYRFACGDSLKLITALKVLNNDYTPSLLFVEEPAGENDRREHLD